MLKGGPQFFDAKPLIIKAWTPDINYAKEPMKMLPIWIKLPGLNVKYWGEKSLYKIAGGVGRAMKVDQATLNRDKLMFAKVLVEVKLDQVFPTTVHFVNENDITMTQPVEYDWLPVGCTICKGIGHDDTQCKHKGKQRMKKVWMPITTAATAAQEVIALVDVDSRATTSDDGFKQTSGVSRQRGQLLRPIVTRNTIQALSDDHSVDEISSEMGDVDGTTKAGELESGTLGKGLASLMPN